MHRLVLLTILSAGLTLRLAVLAAALARGGALMTSDSTGYVESARTLATCGRFAQGPDEPPELVRTPGYPLLLAGLWRLGIGGEPRTASPSQIASPAALTQVAMDVVLIFLTYLMGTRLCDRTVGLAAAALQATSAVAIASSVRLLSDGPFAFVLTAAMLLLLRGLDQQGRRGLFHLAAGAVALAAATYVRPITLLLPVPIGVLLFVSRRPGETCWHLAPAVKAAGLFVAVFLVCVLPWITRNWRSADYPHFSAIASVNLHDYSAVAIRAHEERAGDEEVRAAMRAGLLRDSPDASAAEQYRRQGRIGWSAIADQPWLYAWLHLRSCANSLVPGGTDVLEAVGITSGQRGTLAVLKSSGPLAAARHYFGHFAGGAGVRVLAGAIIMANVLILAAMYSGAVITAVRRLRWRMQPAGWLLLLTALYLLLLPGPASHPRFRVPVSPLLSIAAAAGWVWLAGRRKKNSTTEGQG